MARIWLPAQTPVSLALREPALLVPGRAPVGRVRINRAHELAPTFFFLWTQSPTDVDGKAVMSLTSVEVDPVNGLTFSASTDRAFITGIPAFGTSDFTVLQHVSDMSGSSISDFPAAFGRKDLEAGGLMLRRINNDLFLYGDTGTIVVSASGAAPYNNFAPGLVGVSRIGSTARIYRLGVEVGTADTSAGANLTQTEFQIFGADQAANRYNLGSTKWLAVWIGRGLTSEQVARFDADPFQVLQPAANDPIFIGAAGGGGAVTLTVADCSHGHTVDNVALTQAHTLAVADAAHAHTVDNIDLVQAFALTVADTAHAHTVDSLVLTQAHVLAVADTSHAHTADNVALTQAHTLAVADATHAHTVDNIALVQAHVLAVADATHAHTVDNIALTQAIELAVADATHAHAVDSVSLTQAHVLAVSDTAHAHTADNVVLTLAGQLEVADATHAHTADQVTLTQAHILAVQDATHAHTADNIGLIQAHTLTVADATHAHTVDSPTLDFSTVLIVADSAHAHTVDALSLTQAHVIAVQDALHAHTVDNVALTQAGTLVVSDALHALLSDNINLIVGEIIVGSGRVFLVRADSHVFRVDRDPRVHLIH